MTGGYPMINRHEAFKLTLECLEAQVRNNDGDDRRMERTSGCSVSHCAQGGISSELSDIGLVLVARLIYSLTETQRIQDPSCLPQPCSDKTIYLTYDGDLKRFPYTT